MSSRIVIEPGMKFGSPAIDGSRIEPDVAAHYVLELGEDETLLSFPHLFHDDLLVACWYVARYGRPKDWKPKQMRRLRAWLDDHETAMWEKTDWSGVPLP